MLKLVFLNALRHRLRTLLTVLGVALAIFAFGVVRTLIGAWYLQAEASSPDRLVTRHAVSLTFALPPAYKSRIEALDGVKAVTYANWFGGVYIDRKNFFPQFAADVEGYFSMYPEYIVPPEQWKQAMAERNACIVGEKLAERYGWKQGDLIRLTGTIYPGDWDFVVRAIYSGRDPTTDVSSFFFHWEYLDEKMAQDMPGRQSHVGWYVIQIKDPRAAATISAAVDELFANSTAETLTETEKAFALSFVAMSSAIITGIRLVSVLIIGVVLLVLANTMAMAARERMKEYSVLKTLGFRRIHLIGLIAGESFMLSGLGTLIGLALLWPTKDALAKALGDFFPMLIIEPLTVVLSGVIALGVGAVAAAFPVWRVLTARIVDGLRQVG